MDRLPRTFNFLSYSSARIDEIDAITKKLGQCQHGARAFQNLPRHMQRRAASHNPKRLPRYLREKHKREMGPKVKETKRPSRKYRRRPSNLLTEYNRRQREHIWMETHIWHAKRFHMIKCWGYVLPDSPTNKGYRAAVRAAKKSCLIQDMSYRNCLELEGKEQRLLEGLSTLTTPEGLTQLTRPSVMSGQEWTSVTIYQQSRQPFGAIGNVDIMWHPFVSSESGVLETPCKLWLWIHPSAYHELLAALQQTFSLNPTQSEVSSDGALKDLDTDPHVTTQPCSDNESSAFVGTKCLQELSGQIFEGTKSFKTNIKDVCSDSSASIICAESYSKEKTDQVRNSSSASVSKKNVIESKLATRNVPSSNAPKYKSVDNVLLVDLKDTLNYFRLTGPKSFYVLSEVLTPTTIVLKNKELPTALPEKRGDVNQEKNICTPSPWWNKYYSCTQHRESHTHQEFIWSQLKRKALPPFAILPLTVRDPRVILPSKKISHPVDMDLKSPPEVVDEFYLKQMGNPLLVSSVRDCATKDHLPDAEVNAVRAQQLIPGSALPLTDAEARVPVTILQRPPSRFTGSGYGCDILLPAGWGGAIWVALSLNGGVAGGIQQEETLLSECLMTPAPHLLPDTPAGYQFRQVKKHENLSLYFKRPPSCRHNYIKLGVQFPFSYPWLKLLKCFNPTIEDFFVLRERHSLKLLAQLCKAEKKLKEVHLTDTDYKNGSCGTKSRGKRKADENTASSPQPKKGKRDDEFRVEGLAARDVNGMNGTNVDRFSQKWERAFTELSSVAPSALVYVRLVLEGKGTVEPHAMICLPNDEDQNSYQEHPEVPFSLWETQHPDKNAANRKNLKKEHEKIKKQLQRQRRKAKSHTSGVEMEFVADVPEPRIAHHGTGPEEVSTQSKVTLEKASTYTEQMNQLWLLDEDQPLQQCSRVIFGYITHGGFCMSLGHQAGLGYVALAPFITLIQRQRENQNMQRKQMHVLVRNSSSLQYHWARLIVLEPPM